LTVPDAADKEVLDAVVKNPARVLHGSSDITQILRWPLGKLLVEMPVDLVAEDFI